MKKYLAIFAVLFTVILSSCSNDDIPVTYGITFKVDPSTVISSYQEYDVGDLTSLGSDYQLRVRLLVYDKEGGLVDSDESFSSDYTHVQSFAFKLPEGDYTTVAITDVVGKTTSAVPEFYTLSGEKQLSTTTLTYSDYIGGQLAILGLTTESKSISSTTRDISIKVKPAGALIICFIDNWNACLDWTDNGVPIDAKSYQLWANQFSSDLTLNSFGEPTYSIHSSSDFDYIWYYHTRNSKYEAGYSYAFKFPMTNVKLQWVAETTSKIFNWGDPNALNIEVGKEYLFILDVASDEAYWYDLDIDASKVVSKLNTNQKVVKENIPLKIKDEKVSIKVINYLKQK